MKVKKSNKINNKKIILNNPNNSKWNKIMYNTPINKITLLYKINKYQ